MCHAADIWRLILFQYDGDGHVRGMLSSLAGKWGCEMARMKGTVAWFSNTKGFGFVTRGGGPDIFIHYTAIQSSRYKTLSEGDSIEFDVVLGPNGKEQAANVTKSG